MCLARLITRIGFAIGALAIVTAFGFTIEYEPVLNALAH
jgi:hypothetical protein